MFIRLFCLFFLATSLSIPTTASAQIDIPSFAQGPVLDNAGVLSKQDINTIEQGIQTIQEDTTAEIAIWVLPSTQDEDIAQLTTRVGQTLGVGKKDTDNGLMLIIAAQDRSWFAATGYGLEGVLPDAYVKRLGKRHFPKHFQKEQYASGIVAFLDDSHKILQWDQSIISQMEEKNEESIWPLVIFVIIFVVLWWLGRNGYLPMRSWDRGGFGRGGGFGKSGGWSFGGFSGGSFGGGGAGGRW